MKSIFKTKLFKLTAILLILFISSCEREIETQQVFEVEEPSNIISKEREITPISFEELNQTLGQYKDFQQISKRFKFQKLSKKYSKDGEARVPILQKSTYNNRTKYTLAIEEGDKIQNLSLEIIDHKLKAEFLTYDFSKKTTYDKDAGVFNVGTLKVEPLTQNETADFLNKSSNCTTRVIAYPILCSAEPGAQHKPGEGCPWEGTSDGPSYLYITISICNYDDGSGGQEGPLVIPDCYASGSCGGVVVPGGTGGGGGTTDSDGIGDPGDPIIGNNGQQSAYLAAYEALITYIDSNLSLPSASYQYLQSNIKFLGAPIVNFLKKNNNSLKSKEYIRKALHILRTGNSKQKNFVGAVLHDDIQEAMNIALDGADYQQCCYTDDTGIKMAWFTAKLVFDFHDAMRNLVQMTEDIFNSDEEEGRFAKVVMSNSGIVVPSDVSDATIGRLFKVRYEGGELKVVPTGEWYQAYVDAAITLLDIAAVLAPSSNGGAFLAVKGGGKITAKALADYLKVIAKGKWKTVNESMSDAAKSYQELISGRKWNESFEMPGPVKFDGVKNSVLVEAKSGMLNFVNPNGTFKSFFTGRQGIINQARRQRQAAGDLPIEWHFEHDIVRRAFENLLRRENLNIIFKHTPR